MVEVDLQTKIKQLLDRSTQVFLTKREVIIFLVGFFLAISLIALAHAAHW